MKTREQYKKKKAHCVTVQVQEVDHKHTVQCSLEKMPNEHVVLLRKAPWDWMATSLHAVILFVGIMMEAVMIQIAVICMPRMGVS